MTQAEISGISPFFIVSHVPSSLSFYRDRLGFEITFQGPLLTTSSSASFATDDGLRGFELMDADGYVLFFGRPR